MRIAILGSVALPVPPPAQGGTEWIAYYQAKGLGSRGHKVILFAAKGSKKESEYELVEVGGGDTVVGSNQTGPASQVSQFSLQFASELTKASTITSSSLAQVKLRLGVPPLSHPSLIESSRNLRKENVYLAYVMQKLMDRKDDYDIILNNMRGEAVFLPVAKLLGKPFVNVMHLPLFDELAAIFKTYAVNVITISYAQRKGFDGLNYLATVYNCVDTNKFSFNPVPNPDSLVMLNSFQHPQQNQDFTDNRGIPKQVRDDINGLVLDGKERDYLLMLGTIGRHKNQGAAIAVAKKLGMKLILAGKIRDQDYFEELRKDIDGEKIRWMGELGFEEKLNLYQNAKAFIFPILWEEPFGLVMIEALSCGTPVVAYGNGAIPEVVRDGMTGYVIQNQKSKIKNQKFVIEKEDIDGLVEGVNRINALTDIEYQKLRENCRKHVEEHFTVEKMVGDLEKALLNVSK